MNKNLSTQKATEICHNFNQANLDIKLHVCKDAKEVAEFYKTYNGVTEFLYIAPEDEIKDAIQKGAIFFGVYYKGHLAGLAKASKLTLPYPFFCPPKSMMSLDNFWGLSGLYVHENFRGKKLSTILLKASTSLAEACNATGIYADFDYRNIASMRLVSKYYNLLGYTDGRNGSPDEATIYTTFFKAFTNSVEDVSSISITFDKLTCDTARKTLDSAMANVGNSTIHVVNYCEGFNEIVCFDKPYHFVNTKINITEDITKKVDTTLDK